ncbi:MAG: gfo/Idh/MocA family oxidoreductase [Spirochaetaceae bacterium]|nr:MAG: gfo/Idh/MocA family oxidoreductase [Spirochaetaceae bacterium]
MKYRMIQTGLGDFGRRWLDVVRAHRAWEIAAIATRNEQTRQSCGDLAGVPDSGRFATLAEALHPDVGADALLVTTPHFRHTDDVLSGLERGLHVLVEKPLAGSWEECLRIRSAALASDRVVMVAENYRFGEGARIARQIVASGEIGVPEFLSMEYFVGHTFPDGDWRNEYAYPLLIENATHQFDLVRYVTGSDATRVYCAASGSQRTPHWKAPSVSAVFEMSGGLQFQFAGSWAYDEFITPWEGVWRLHGSDGSMAWTQDAIEVRRGAESRTIAVPSRPSDWTLTATFDEFTAAIDERRAPETALTDNIQTVAMVYAAIRSAEQRVPISVADMLLE